MTPTPVPQNNSLLLRTLILIILILPVYIVFMGSLDNDFVNWDDHEYVYNPIIRGMDGPHLWNMLTSLEPVYWHPVTWFSHAIDYQLFGKNPGGHHLTGILIHSLNALWVYLLSVHFLSRCNGASVNRSVVIGASLWAALLFALHPLRVESVVWAAERKDLLCAFFLFPAFLTYMKYLDAGTASRKRYWYRITLLLFMLALMSKPMAVTFPVVLLFLDVWPYQRLKTFGDLSRLVWEKAPLFLMSLICGLVTIYAQKVAGAVMPTNMLDPLQRILNAVHSLFFYIEKTVFPVSLTPLYPFHRDLSLDNGILLGSCAALILVTAFFLRQGLKKSWCLMVVWLYYLVTVAPVIGILQVGRQAAADRFTYIPTLGFYLLAGYALYFFWNRVAGLKASGLYRGVLFFTGVMILAFLGAKTIAQVPVWKNSGTLWEAVIERYPTRFPIAYHNLGHFKGDQGNFDEATEFIEMAITLNPRFPAALNDLGIIRLTQGSLEQAEQLFRQALQYGEKEVTLNNLGLLNHERKQYDMALRYYEQSLEINPGFNTAQINKGSVYLEMGKLEQAEKTLREAINRDFDIFQAHANLGLVYRKQNNWPGALAEYSIASYLSPENAKVHQLLGDALWNTGRKQEALSQWRESLRLQPDHNEAEQRLQTTGNLP